MDCDCAPAPGSAKVRTPLAGWLVPVLGNAELYTPYPPLWTHPPQIKTHLDFIPNIGAIKNGLTNNGDEADEMGDNLYEQLHKIRDELEVKIPSSNPTSSGEAHSTPKAKYVSFALSKY